ncbi:hypothetical protein IB262_35305 [Ensifer sp. ENS02]|nr:hypothetical protein [Ensifer sp. ENS02]
MTGVVIKTAIALPSAMIVLLTINDLQARRGRDSLTKINSTFAFIRQQNERDEYICNIQFGVNYGPSVAQWKIRNSYIAVICVNDVDSVRGAEHHHAYYSSEKTPEADRVGEVMGKASWSTGS